MDKMKYHAEPPQQWLRTVVTLPKSKIIHESFNAKIPDKKTFNESGTNSALNKTTIDDTSVASKMKNFTNLVC